MYGKTDLGDFFLRGGSWPSTVADELIAEGRLGVKLGEAPEVARKALEDEVKNT
jgi:acetylornithine deacetylase